MVIQASVETTVRIIVIENFFPVLLKPVSVSASDRAISSPITSVLSRASEIGYSELVTSTFALVRSVVRAECWNRDVRRCGRVVSVCLIRVARLLRWRIITVEARLRGRNEESVGRVRSRSVLCVRPIVDTRERKGGRRRHRVPRLEVSLTTL